MTRYRCDTCRDTGRVSNGCDPFNPGYDDAPCPEPDCAEGESEREGAWQVREKAAAQSNVHPTIAQALAPFAPKEAA